MNRIEFIRGDTQTFNVEINDTTGIPYKLQPNDKLVFTLKRTVYDTNIILQKNIDASMTFKLEHDETKALNFGVYQYDIQLTQADGTVITVIPPSPLMLKEEVNYD